MDKKSNNTAPCVHDEVNVDMCRNYTDDGYDIGVDCAKCGESLMVMNR